MEKDRKTDTEIDKRDRYMGRDQEMKPPFFERKNENELNKFQWTSSSIGPCFLSLLSYTLNLYICPISIGTLKKKASQSNMMSSSIHLHHFYLYLLLY